MSELTPQTAPGAPAPVADQKSQASTGDWVGGVLISVLLPLIGLIVGIVYTLKGGSKRTVGLMCIGLSVAMAVVWFAVTSA
jgi:hypothetical protein